MQHPDLKYLIALNSFPKFGPVMLGRLNAAFPSMEAAFHATEIELIKTGIHAAKASAFVAMREHIHPDDLLDEVERAGVNVITRDSDIYPPMLATIYDPPAVLFVRGELPPHEVAHVAIVGSRAATPYGLRIAKTFAQALATSGVVIVSGLAFGIDEAAQSATVDGHGITVGVLGCGLLQMDSRQRFLADKIVSGGGAVISEFPMQMAGMKQNYPIRNRIISGLSHATLIVEAAESSGSLITARSALEQGRDVFAIPGPIDSTTSSGSNRLLKEGASVATDPSDILETLNVARTESIVRAPQELLFGDEAKLVALLSKQPTHIDELTRQSTLPSHTVAGVLSLLELKGRTRQIGGMYYILL